MTILKHEVLSQHVDIETKSSYGIYVDLLESIIMIFTNFCQCLLSALS